MDDSSLKSGGSITDKMASQEQCDICDICDRTITSDRSNISERGLPNVIKISADLKDGLDKKLSHKTCPIPVHLSCKKQYTMPSNIRKRKRESSESLHAAEKKIHCRSQSSKFNIKEDCLYCGEFVDKTAKLPTHRRDQSHNAATKELLSSVAAKSLQRADSWGEAVYIRIQGTGDLVAAEATYHHDCQIRFHDGRQLSKNTKGRPSGSVDIRKNDAFQKLCDYIDNNEIHQYSISDLESLLKQYSGEDECYTAKHLKVKLQEHYKDNIIITSESGKETIYTFLDTGNTILRDNYKAAGLTAQEVVDIAATLIEDQMRSIVCDTTQYPKFSDMGNSETMVPELLMRFLSRLIKNKRRQLGIAHSITAAARPRSFISPILLAISVYINSKMESRELIDLLCSLGFADDYREVQRLYNAMLPTDEPEREWAGSLVNFVFDNADIDIRTLTGHGTWHAMGGIAGITPGGDYTEPVLPRSTTVRPAADVGRYAEIPLKNYRKPAVPGLKQVIIGPQEHPNPNPPSLKLATLLDNLWMASYFLSDPAQCPSWRGFNQTVVTQGQYDISRIEILPFLNHDPNHADTIYSALAYAQSLAEKHQLGVCPVTFDQPLYIKAAEIVQASPDLTNPIVRLGGFHLVMSYMGAIGYIMSGSGLQGQWETVYATNSIKHMMTGHAYAHALRAHMLSAVSIVSLMLDTPNCLSGVNLDKLRALHSMLLKRECLEETVLHEHAVEQLTQILGDLEQEFSLRCKTGKLWIEYLKMVRTLLLFLRAERTGDWELHLFCISKMIPVLHSGGHTAYAKSTRLYLQQMRQLSNLMDPHQYVKYTSGGYWTIRRSHRFWSGGFTDQTIEQVLMRMLKTRGGLAHGRGINTGTQAKMVYALPQTVPVCQSLEDFCGVHSQTTDQHCDLRDATTARDGRHFLAFKNYLSQHSPFSYIGQYENRLVCIATGVVAPVCANAECAVEVGEQVAAHLTGLNFADAKLKRNDKVTSIGAATNSTTVRGHDVEIDPTLLFMRVTCTIKKSSDMEKHLKHEFSKQPPSLFDKGTMRKTAKSVLAQQLKTLVAPISASTLQHPYYVIDGGYLLHSVTWPLNCSYGDVCANYVSYVINNYGTDCTVCFDGYTNVSMSTKVAEQNRRGDPNASADVIFDETTSVTNSRQSILANRNNKARIISKVMEGLRAECVRCCQSVADADYLIANTTIVQADNMQRPVVLVGNDTDLLVMLINGSRTDNVYMQYARDSVYSVHSITQTMNPSVHQHILIAHAISGCDTVSALYGVGKKKPMAVLERGEWGILDAFQRSDSSHDEVARVGELFLLKLYGASDACNSLDKLRYVLYMQKVSKTSSTFQLQSLPPTSAAAKYHSYRAYYAVQEWLGNVGDIEPTEWGWELQGGMLSPILTDRPVAPEAVLLIVSCGCKTTCGKRCKCRKAGLYCTPMCSSCIGQTCSNACEPDEDVD